MTINLMPLDQWKTGESCSSLKSPTSGGDYYFEYLSIPFFTELPLGDQQVDRDLKRFLYKYRTDVGRLEDVGMTVIPSDNVIPQPLNVRVLDAIPTTVLKVNGHYPGGDQKLIKPGYSQSPIIFEWSSSNIAGYEIQYRYGLFYTDERFSDWSSATQAAYSLIYPGNQEFRVQVRYRVKGSEQWREAGETSYAFSVPKAFVSGGITKGYGSITQATQPSVKPEDVYKRSIALIVSVTRFDHADKFQPLAYTAKDAERMAHVLKARNFDIRYLNETPDSKSIINFIDKTANRTEIGDRVVIYFSTHGFQDKNSGNVYLASSDCDPDQVNTTCVSLAFIDDAVARIQKKAKHSLVILDACSAGLGVITKELEGQTSFYESALLHEPGAHMITAGMADQQARPDATNQMSEFTKFLVAGIEGAADSNKKGVVTLLDLMAYVRGQVAKGYGGLPNTDDGKNFWDWRNYVLIITLITMPFERRA